MSFITDYLTLTNTVVAGLFALVCGYIGWLLKSRSDERMRLLALRKEQRDTIRQLYVDVYKTIHGAIGKIHSYSGLAFAEEFADIQARVHLLAPESVMVRYDETIDAMGKWAGLHNKGAPLRLPVGDKAVTPVVPSRASEDWKVPAEAAYEVFRRSF